MSFFIIFFYLVKFLLVFINLKVLILLNLYFKILVFFHYFLINRVFINLPYIFHSLLKSFINKYILYKISLLKNVKLQ